MNQDKIKSMTISDTVFGRIRASILDGVLRPGERIAPERQLALEMGVSRSSVREAFQKLAAMGLVEHRQGGGTFVSNSSETNLSDPLVQMLETRPEAIYELLEMRMALETIAAHYAALRATETDIEILRHRLEAITVAHEKADTAAEADADAEFHLSVADAAHNSVLVHVMRGVVSALRTGISASRQKLFTRKGAREALIAHHRALFDAIAKGEAKAARGAVTEHLEYVKNQLAEMQKEAAWEDESKRRLNTLTGGKRE